MGRPLTAAQKITRSQAEIDFQRQITDLCDLLGLKWHHEVDSRKSKTGFPDLLIAGRYVIFAELKRETGKASPDQLGWLGRLERAGANTYLWRPSDWPEIQRVLLDCAGRRVVSGHGDRSGPHSPDGRG